MKLFWCSSWCGSAQYAESIGSSENETKSETSTEQAIVRGKRLEPLAAHAGHKGNRDEDREDREGRRRHGQANLVRPLTRGGVVILPHLNVSHDVLAHHNGIVNEDTDRQRKSEQRHRLELEAEGPDRDERRHD